MSKGPKKLIDWFDKKTAKWIGTCTECGKQYIHRGTEPTQEKCNKIGCDGTIIWQIDEL